MTDPKMPARPTTVTASFFTWLLATALGVVTAVFSFVSAGNVVAEGDATTTANFFGITYVFAGLLVLVLTAIQAVVVWRMRVGRNWARVVLTVLAVLQVVNAIFSLGLNLALGSIGIVLVVVATVLMWLPSANAFFGRRSTVAP